MLQGDTILRCLSFSCISGPLTPKQRQLTELDSNLILKTKTFI